LGKLLNYRSLVYYVEQNIYDILVKVYHIDLYFASEFKMI